MNIDAIKQAIAVLNEALERDPVAINKLFATRVDANASLAAHPTIQVCAVADADRLWTVGILGIINGLFGIDEDGWGYITSIHDTIDGPILRFCFIEDQ